YIAQLVAHEKQFLVIGSKNAGTYREVFPLIREGKLWYGASINSGDREFGVPDHYPLTAAGSRIDDEGRKFVRVKGVRWFTNMDHAKRHEELILFKRYSPHEYPMYDNYDAINVGKTAYIPMDYEGVMGVPITFLDKHNPDQFDILGVSYLWDDGFESHKCYANYVEVRQNGTKTGMSGKKSNGLAVLKGKPTKGNYLVHGDDAVHTLYKRLFVRRKT
ncbi:hypothetical protein F4009_05350, partial [Candidatus Poribacteria bacterium]|nr:hypothetical protein [Candidatus Poribacteria bacterium]